MKFQGYYCPGPTGKPNNLLGNPNPPAGTKASVPPRVCAETVDLVAASAANPEMGERPQRRVNFVSLDQYDHEWPRSITKPHHRAVSVIIDSAMDYPHSAVLLVKSDAGVRVGDHQRDMSKADVMG